MNLNDQIQIFKAQCLITDQHQREFELAKKAVLANKVVSEINDNHCLRLRVDNGDNIRIGSDHNSMPLDVFLELAEKLKAIL